MATVAEIQVAVVARLSNFRKRMNRAQRTIRRFRRSVAALSTGVAAMGGVIAAVATGALALFVRNASSAADEAIKFARFLGVSVDSLRALEFAAEQTGNNVRTLRMGMQRMTRRISEAARGSGEAGKAIEELGLSAASLARMAPDEQFLRIADAMRGVSSQGDKIRLAFRIFDSEGARLVNTMEGGSAAIRALAREFDSLGNSLSEADAERLEEMNDALNKLSKAWRGFAEQLAVTVAPRVVEALESMTKAMSDFSVERKIAGFLVRRTLGEAKVGQLESESRTIVDRFLVGIARSAKGAAREERAANEAKRLDELTRETALMAARLRLFLRSRANARALDEQRRLGESSATTLAKSSLAPRRATVQGFQFNRRRSLAAESIGGFTSRFAGRIAPSTQRETLDVSRAQLREQQAANEGLRRIVEEFRKLTAPGPQ